VSYQRNLTFNLRLRGLSEEDITEVLDEIQAHEAATGDPAEAEFGGAEEYAKQFPKKKRRTPGYAIVVIGATLAIAYVLLTILLMFFRIDIREYVGQITLLPAVLMLFASILAGFLTDYFRPARSSRSR
jgi:hypothetical protein